ncbi:MAG: HAD hydrolase family protein, partial [Planctomycetota bacterium]
MTYRLLALDLDGTTIAPDGTVRPATIAAIRRALDHGLLVIFATGRNYAESKPILDVIGHHPTGIFVGGA